VFLLGYFLSQDYAIVKVENSVIPRIELKEVKYDMSITEVNKDEFYRIQNTIANVIKAHNYTSDYNCINFSKDTVSALKNQEIQSFLISSSPMYDNVSNHMYIAIAFEPQTGRLMNASEWNTYKFGMVSNTTEDVIKFKEYIVK
jgi:hypothetical protein